MDHHEFSPSRLEQFRICPGSYKMQIGIKEPESEWSQEGTKLHVAVAAVARGADIADQGLDEEQAAQVSKCIDFLAGIAKDNHVYYEHKVHVCGSAGDILTYGTADVIVVGSGGALTVIDWKFGYTPVKNVNENIQLASYAAGAMRSFGCNNCDCWVFQPRISAKSHHFFTNETAIVLNIESIIKRANENEMVLNATEESCRYCSARLNCPAFRFKFQRLAANKGDYDLSHIPTLVDLFEASKGVKTFISEIEGEVKRIIEEKGCCGKYGFQISEGSREINDLNALYAVVKDYLTPREFNEVCRVSIGKLENSVSGKLIAAANAKGEKLSKNEAKQRCYSLIADLITRGNPTKKIVEVA